MLKTVGTRARARIPFPVSAVPLQPHSNRYTLAILGWLHIGLMPWHNHQQTPPRITNTKNASSICRMWHSNRASLAHEHYQRRPPLMCTIPQQNTWTEEKTYIWWSNLDRHLGPLELCVQTPNNKKWCGRLHEKSRPTRPNITNQLYTCWFYAKHGDRQ